MGVDLAPLVTTQAIELKDLKGRKLAIDANNVLHQFLSSIRRSDGRPLTDSEGNVTSHLIGLLYRSTRLIQHYQIRLVYVFDGEPPELKREEIKKRKERREAARREWKKALEEKDYATARSKAVRGTWLTDSMLRDAKRLLEFLGIPFVQAPGEAEAQAAYMTKRGDVWASNSRDYDTLLFGSPRLLRYLTVSAKRRPELIILNDLLSSQEISQEHLIDIAILIGTDYNEGVKGIGPKTALRLIKEHGRIQKLPTKVQSRVTRNYDHIRRIFLEPEVTSDYSIRYSSLQEEEIRRFLCCQRGLSEKRVETAVKRMEKYYSFQQET